jgi:hypothetical protein
VLKHSIARNTSRSIEVAPLYQSGIGIPLPRDPHNHPKTPFSFQRFTIPEVRDFRGRAIYLDSDMLVFKDIGPLFDYPFGDANVLAVPHETSLMLLDCERLTWKIGDLVADLDRGQMSYDGLMSCRSVAKLRYDLPPTWNWLDNLNKPPPENLGLLHYTTTSSQPWLSAGHPLGHWWLQELFLALDDGKLRRAEVEQCVHRGFVRPSLLYQMDHRVVRKAELPADILAADQPFADYCRSVHFVIGEGFQAARCKPLRTC